MPATTFQTTFSSNLASLEHATEEALGFVARNGIGDRPAYAVRLAIEEMSTNILKYGYDDTAVHQVLLRVEIEPGRVVLVLEDDGHEFNPLAVAEPGVGTNLAGREPGGLGIHLVRKFVDGMSYERLGGRNRLTIRIQA